MQQCRTIPLEAAPNLLVSKLGSQLTAHRLSSLSWLCRTAMQKQIQQRDEQLSQLAVASSQHAAKEQEILQCRQAAQDSQAAAEALKAQLAKQKEHVQGLGVALCKSRQHAEQLQSARLQAEQHCISQLEDLAKLRAELQRLREEHSQRGDTLQQETARANAQLDKLQLQQSQLDSLQLDVHSLKQQQECWDSKQAQGAVEATELKSLNMQLEAEIKQLRDSAECAGSFQRERSSVPDGTASARLSAGHQVCLLCMPAMMQISVTHFGPDAHATANLQACKKFRYGH